MKQKQAVIWLTESENTWMVNIWKELKSELNFVTLHGFLCQDFDLLSNLIDFHARFIFDTKMYEVKDFEQITKYFWVCFLICEVRQHDLYLMTC